MFARVVGVTLDELSRGIGAVGGKRGTVENGDLERCVRRHVLIPDTQPASV